MTLSLKQKLVLGFGILAAYILGIGFVTYQSIGRIMESDRQVDHTIDVIDQLQTLEYGFKKSQSDYRTYLLTQDRLYLQASYAAMKLVFQMAKDIREMTADNPRQQENFRQLIPLLETRWENLQADRALGEAGHFPQILAQFKSGHYPISNSTDQLINRMLVEEQNLLARRRDLENQNAHVTLVIILLGGVAAAVFAFAALLVINHEVRERAKFQEMLQVNEFRLFQFLEAVPVGIFIADASGKPYYVNQAAKTLLGRDVIPSVRNENMGEAYQAYLKGTDQLYPVERSPMQRALRGEKCSAEDLEIHRPDGSIVPLEVWGTPVTDRKGQVQYGITVFNDITERRNLEQMKESLVSVVSHQLKTPVGEINGYIENLLDGIAGELSSRQKDYLLDMREIGMDNYQMISSLLSLSRLERGILRVEVSPVSLEEIVRYALRDYEKSLERKGLSLTQTGLEPGLVVMADQEKAVECLRNLINNAVKFTDKGGLTLEAEARGDEILLRVKDTGTGLSQAAVEQLFLQKKFLGSESGRAGAGLGLYMVKQFMKLQGGDVTAESVPGKGACFTLVLRRAPGEAAPT